jgi:hypothetical protein
MKHKFISREECEGGKVKADRELSQIAVHREIIAIQKIMRPFGDRDQFDKYRLDAFFLDKI